MTDYQTYIFDLDGTLLDTLGDLAAAVNHSMRRHGMPLHSVDSVRSFVGNGIRVLMQRAVPGGEDNPRFADALADFQQYYLAHSLDTTRPYEGIPQLLAELRRRGKRVAVVSNKFCEATQQLCRHFFPDTVEVAVGEHEAEGIRKKPAPDTVMEALRQLGMDRQGAVYVGDSDVDLLTARNSGLPCISVLWGFRDRDFLLQHGATAFVSTPAEMISDMKKDRLCFALFGNIYQHEKSASVRHVLDCLQAHGAQISIESDYCNFLRSSGLIDRDDIETFCGSDFEADFAISMGGDGTLLRTASHVREKLTPILGVNMGRLGFLADFTAADFDATVDALYRDDYRVEDRSLIRVTTDGESIEGYDCALNDVAILKRDTASMISIRTCIRTADSQKAEGEYLTTYQADGLVVSTPTGSTAYSLSNGGPIIVPRTGVLLLTAVAPHSLNVRPIVIPDSAEVELTVSSRSHTFLVAIDGRSIKMPEGTTVRLSRAPYRLKVVKRPTTSYFATLREKMMWGADTRDH